jgi:hypothetical protein
MMRLLAEAKVRGPAAIHDPAVIARALGLTAAGCDPAGCRAPLAAEGDAANEGHAVD